MPNYQFDRRYCHFVFFELCGHYARLQYSSCYAQIITKHGFFPCLMTAIPVYKLPIKLDHQYDITHLYIMYTFMCVCVCVNSLFCHLCSKNPSNSGFAHTEALGPCLTKLAPASFLSTDLITYRSTDLLSHRFLFHNVILVGFASISSSLTLRSPLFGLLKQQRVPCTKPYLHAWRVQRLSKN